MNGKGWSAAEVRRVGTKVVDLIARYLEQLGDGPVWKPVPRELVEAWQHAPLPTACQSSDDILDAFARDIAPYPFGNGHPRFFGWVNSPPTEIGIFADALAAAMNPSVAGGDHAAVHVERQVVRWFAEMLAFPAGAMGLLVSGSSVAALTGLAVARLHACQRIGHDVRADGLPRCAVFHLAAHGAKPRAPLELLAGLAGSLWRSHGLRPLLVGTETDPPASQVAQLAGIAPSELIDLRGATDLAELAWLLGSAALCAARDSGPAQLAAAMGCRTLVFFVDPRPILGPVRWTPLGSRVEALAPGPENFTVAAAQAAAERLLAK